MPAPADPIPLSDVTSQAVELIDLVLDGGTAPELTEARLRAELEPVFTASDLDDVRAVLNRVSQFLSQALPRELEQIRSELAAGYQGNADAQIARHFAAVRETATSTGMKFGELAAILNGAQDALHTAWTSVSGSSAGGTGEVSATGGHTSGRAGDSAGTAAHGHAASQDAAARTTWDTCANHLRDYGARAARIQGGRTDRVGGPPRGHRGPVPPGPGGPGGPGPGLGPGGPGGTLPAPGPGGPGWSGPGSGTVGTGDGGTSLAGYVPTGHVAGLGGSPSAAGLGGSGLGGLGGGISGAGTSGPAGIGGLGAVPAAESAGAADAAGAAAAGDAGREGMVGGAPMGGGRGGGGESDRDRSAWLIEDDDLWAAEDAPGGLIE